MLKTSAGVAMSIFWDSSKDALEAAASAATIRRRLLYTSLVSQQALPMPTRRAPAMLDMEMDASAEPIHETAPKMTALLKAPKRPHEKKAD